MKALVCGVDGGATSRPALNIQRAAGAGVPGVWSLGALDTASREMTVR